MRGGEQLPVELETGSQLLLAELWDKLGGPTLIASLCGVHRQSCINWKLRGQVPLVYVRKVSETLNIPMWGLNYTGLSALYPDLPPWDKVVRSYGLDRKSTAKILKLKPPEKGVS